MKETLTAHLDRLNERLSAHPKALFLFVALFGAIQIGPWWYTAPDSTCYLSIARSMGQPDGPTNLGRSQLYYSIGYPLLLAPTFLLDDRPFVWIAILHGLLTLLLMAGVYRWASPLGASTALVATLVTVVHAVYGHSVRRPLSETFFMTAMVWTAITLDQVRTSDVRRRRIFAGIVGPLLLTLTCLIRPNGITMIPGFAAALIISAWGDRRRLISAVVLAAIIGGLAGGAFFVSRKLDDRRATTPNSFTYWDQLASIEGTDKPTMAARLLKGAMVQMYDFERIVIPGAFKARTYSQGWLNVNLPFGIAAAVLVFLGWRRAVKMNGDVWIWTFPFYLALNVLWAEDTGTRYTLPVLPIVLAAFWLGLTSFWKEASRWVFAYIILHAAVGFGFWIASDLPKARRHNQHWQSVERLTSRVDPNRQSFGAWRLSADQIQFFRFTLDRDVVPYSLDAVPSIGGFPVTTTTPPDLLFADADVPPPPDYETLETDRPFTLLRRVK